MAAGVLTLGSVDPAAAAKTGGRIGGQAFRPSAPRASAPTPNTSKLRLTMTNIYVNPPVAPPLVGGYGYGFGVPYYADGAGLPSHSSPQLQALLLALEGISTFSFSSLFLGQLLHSLGDYSDQDKTTMNTKTTKRT
ncbi:hypothetical protein SASPL_112110 [Salvia splendens]|uniref:Uncharacterized protein n=1 Tax=Salvia splendens TaxID=180675 RepID=A0A8X8YDT9_SALSN|nr:hypothetical protein SASPL_112110 [Salvia splendens]